MTPTDRPAMRAFLVGMHDAEANFLVELVRAPSDNPPGDCAAHAEHTAILLERMGLTVERHPVPTAVRRRPGDRDERAW